MKKLLVVASLFSCIGVEASFACMQSEEIIKNSWELAKKKQTFSTTGMIISRGKDGVFGFGSGILVDEKTVLCDGHTTGNLSNPETYFSLSSEVNLALNKDYSNNFEKIIKGLDESCSSEVVKTISHPDYKLIQNQVQLNLKNQKEIKYYLEFLYKKHLSIGNVDKVMERTKFGPDNESIIESWQGPDLVVLKLKNPIKPPYGFLKINDNDLEENSVSKGFSLGYPMPTLYDGTDKPDYNGINNSVTVHRCVLENSGTFHKLNLLYEQLKSPGSQDGMFVPEKKMPRFAGLLGRGMSGGSFLSRDKNNEFKITGIASRIQSSSFFGELNGLRDSIQSHGWNESITLIDNYLKDICSKNTPIYNVWTPIGSNENDWIKKYMEE